MTIFDIFDVLALVFFTYWVIGILTYGVLCILGIKADKVPMDEEVGLFGYCLFLWILVWSSMYHDMIRRWG